MTPDESWERWRAALATAYADITALFHNRHVWRTLIETLEGNPDVEHHSVVNDWLSRVYSTTQAVGIRRQAYDRDDQVTLARVLAEIEQHPEVATFDRFLAASDPLDRDYAEQDWRRDWQSSGHAAHVDPTRVAADLERLRVAAAPVKRYVDKRLAHHDKRVDMVPLTYPEINVALDVLGAVLTRYYRLLAGKILLYVTPEVGLGWAEMFRTAWASDGFVPRRAQDIG